MGEHKALLMSAQDESWNSSCASAIRFYVGDDKLQVSCADTLQQAIDFLRNDDAFEIVFFYTYKWTDCDPLEAIRRLRIDGYLGALIVFSASPHSLQDLAEMYPLAKLVDVVYEIPWVHLDQVKLTVNEALLRAKERKMGIFEREAIWWSSPSVSGPGAIGFRIWSSD